MSQIVETIDVDVPVRTAYDQWTQFEGPRRVRGGARSRRVRAKSPRACNAPRVTD